MPDAPAAWDKITIFHLLTHISGIPSFTGFPDYKSKEPFSTTPEELVARFRDKPLLFHPVASFLTTIPPFLLDPLFTRSIWTTTTSVLRKKYSPPSACNIADRL